MSSLQKVMLPATSQYLKKYFNIYSPLISFYLVFYAHMIIL